MGRKRHRVDLHGCDKLQAREKLERAVSAYIAASQDGMPLDALEIVHGYGSSGQGDGGLRQMVRDYLATHAWLKAIPGEQFGNPGCTYAEIS